MSGSLTVSVDARLLLARIARVRDALRPERLEGAAAAGAELIAAAWREELRAPGSPSLPGVPPRIGPDDRYRESIQVQPHERDDHAASVVVGTDIVDTPYPAFLEFGTSRMAAHPSARPAYETSKGPALEATLASAATLVHEALG